MDLGLQGLVELVGKSSGESNFIPSNPFQALLDEGVGGDTILDGYVHTKEICFFVTRSSLSKENETFSGFKYLDIDEINVVPFGQSWADDVNYDNDSREGSDIVVESTVNPSLALIPFEVTSIPGTFQKARKRGRLPKQQRHRQIHKEIEASLSKPATQASSKLSK